METCSGKYACDTDLLCETVEDWRDDAGRERMRRAERDGGTCTDMLDEQACMPPSKHRIEPYAWPGGYQLLYLVETFNGHHWNTGEMCPACTDREVRRVEWIRNIDRFDDRFRHDERVKLRAFTHEEGPSIFCDECQEEFPSEYGDPWAEDDDESEGE